MAKESRKLFRGPLAAGIAAALALGLGGCGGGSTVRPTPPPSQPSSPPPASTSYQPPVDAQLDLTDTYAAHDAGYTGKGITIGIVDTGINPDHPALTGRVGKLLVYVDPSTNDTTKGDVVGHGTMVSEVAAGTSFGQWPGGIAPGADLVSARIISDKAPSDNGSNAGSAVGATDADFFGQTLNPALEDAGVKVQNNSWGGLYWDPSNTDTVGKAFAAAYHHFVVDYGGLVVFATGNDSNAQPSDTASIPYWEPDLERGWLAVAALDTQHPTQLASYSNACGRAMDYCLVAPGELIVTGANDTAGKPDYYIVQGTSFAAPQVSGAAAVVWQAFPYFSNDLVRQTLLGTATDLGAAGPDPTFGYGLLDVGKAVQGPGKFDWGDVSVSFDGTTSTWSNDISGAGGLSKGGSGTLVLAGNDTYQGDTQVLGGALQSANALPGNVSVAAGATLSGIYGAGATAVGVPGVKGNLDNAGTVMVAGADTMVSGNYTQAASGTLSISLGSLLQVGGAATINGGTLYIAGADSGYVTTAHQNVVTAQGGVTGTFDRLTEASNVFLSTTIQYDANDVWLDTTSLNITATVASAGFGAQPVVMSSASRLDTTFNAINTGLASGSISPASDLVSTAGAIQHTRTLSAAQVSLQSLSGELHAASAALTFEAIDASNLALSRRFDQLLENGGGYGMWTRNLSMSGAMSRSGYDGVGFQLNGWLVGADRKLGENGIAGYAFGQSQGDQRLDQRIDHSTSRDTEGMAYVGWIHGRSYVQGRLGFGSVNQDISRALLLGPRWQGVSTHYNGTYSLAYGESGMHFDAGGGTQFTPYVNVQYAQIKRNGFTEQGAYGFGLTAGANTLDRWQAGAGIRASRHLQLSGGQSIDFTARAQWQQTLASSGDVYNASFVGMQDWQPLVGIGVSRYSGLFGVGMDAKLSERSRLNVGYDYQVGQRITSRQVTARYTFRF